MKNFALSVLMSLLMMASASAAGLADFAGTYKGGGTATHLGTVYKSAISLRVDDQGNATMIEVLNWSLGQVRKDYAGFVNARGDFVLRTASGDKVVGGTIRGRTANAIATGLTMTFGADPRSFRLTRQ